MDFVLVDGHEYISVIDARDRYQVDQWNIRSWIRKGKLASKKLDRNLWPLEKRSGKPVEIIAVRRDELENLI